MTHHTLEQRAPTQTTTQDASPDAPAGAAPADPEAARLAALREYAILDTAPEPAFDDLTLLASRICGVPMSTVTFVDAERQWFKSRVGVDAPQTSREVSFCAHAILGGGLLVVPDATKDLRFRDNPLVCGEPHIRFYAGAPLITPDGHALGTLCVIDVVPHELTAAQGEALAALSRQAAALLELRKSDLRLRRLVEEQLDTERKLRQSEAMLRRIAENSVDVITRHALDSTYLYVSPVIRELAGFEPEEMLGRFPQDFIHPQDWPPVQQRITELLTTGEPARARYRSITKDGRYLWWESTARAVRDANSGALVEFLATSRDVTEQRKAEEALRESEERFKRIANSAPIGIFVCGADGECTYANPAYLGISGLTLEEATGHGWVSAVHPEDLPRVMDEWRAVQTAFVNDPTRQGGYTIEHRYLRPDGSVVWGRVRGGAYRDGQNVLGWVGTVEDVTERRAWEENLRRAKDELERRVQERTVELARSNTSLVEEVAERRRAHHELLEHRQKLRAMTAQLASAEEAERRRIARGLHDEIGQALAMAKIKLAALEQCEHDGARAAAGDVRAFMERAIQQVRTLTFELGSRVLYDFGLEAAIENAVERLQRDHKQIHASFEDDGLPKRISEDVAISLLQGTKELLHNVVKHANARHVRVTIERQADEVQVGVQDDGIGYEAGRLAAAAKKPDDVYGGFGLFSIRERLDYIGGRMSIESSPGRGMRVTMSAPLRADDVSPAQRSDATSAPVTAPTPPTPPMPPVPAVPAVPATAVSNSPEPDRESSR